MEPITIDTTAASSFASGFSSSFRNFLSTDIGYAVVALLGAGVIFLLCKLAVRLIRRSAERDFYG